MMFSLSNVARSFISNIPVWYAELSLGTVEIFSMLVIIESTSLSILRRFVDSVGNIQTGFFPMISTSSFVVSPMFTITAVKSCFISTKWAWITRGSEEPTIPSKWPRILSSG